MIWRWLLMPFVVVGTLEVLVRLAGRVLSRFPTEGTHDA